MKTQTNHTPTPKWEARPKVWKGNLIGFRVFKNGVKMAEHINALRADEAIAKVIAKAEGRE